MRWGTIAAAAVLCILVAPSNPAARDDCSDDTKRAYDDGYDDARADLCRKARNNLSDKIYTALRDELICR